MDDPRPDLSTRDSANGITTERPVDSSIGPQVLAALDALPTPLVIVDRHGRLLFCSLGAAAMLGRPRDEMAGAPIESIVHPDDRALLHGLLDVPSVAPAHARDLTVGPGRIRCLDASGSPRWTQLWGRTTPPEFGVGGFLLTLIPESVRDALLTAVSPVATDQHLDSTLAEVAASVAAAPIGGVGSILAVLPVAADDPARFRPTGVWPLDDASLNAFGTPWRRALVDEIAIDIHDVASEGMSPQARDALSVRGFRSAFIRPIRDLGGSIVGVLVVFRVSDEPIGVAHTTHLDDVARFAGLAFAQARRISELESATRRDALTGMFNQAALDDRLASDPAAADVLTIDLDHLTSVNETFGHRHGDRVIADAAERIRSAVAREDTVYRVDGDEFVVVRGGATDGVRALGATAERIIDRLMAPFDVDDHRIRIGASVGVATGRDLSLHQSLEASRRALHSAKERGRAGFVIAPAVAARSAVADGPWHAIPGPIPPAGSVAHAGHASRSARREVPWCPSAGAGGEDGVPERHTRLPRLAEVDAAGRPAADRASDGIDTVDDGTQPGVVETRFAER